MLTVLPWDTEGDWDWRVGLSPPLEDLALACDCCRWCEASKSWQSEVSLEDTFMKSGRLSGSRGGLAELPGTKDEGTEGWDEGTQVWGCWDIWARLWWGLAGGLCVGGLLA